MSAVTYTAEELAELAGVSSWSIYNSVRDGTCPFPSRAAPAVALCSQWDRATASSGSTPNPNARTLAMTSRFGSDG